MAGKFINTVKRDTIDNIVTTQKHILDNPYYAYADKQATVVTYLSQNDGKSTLDPGNYKAYTDHGSESPIRFNKINNMFIYGIEKISLSLELGDFGVTAEDITGSCYFLPGFEPKPNDYFTISYLDQKIIFKITGNIQNNTLDSGVNIYSADYKYAKSDDISEAFEIVDEYEMLVDNIGTDFKSIILKADYKFVSTLDEFLDKLRQYYKMLFYSDRVQCFIFRDEFGKNVYDPMVVEFIIRNNLMKDNGNYLYVGQQITLPPYFQLHYDHTIFRSVELRNKSLNKVVIDGVLSTIREPLSMLSMRTEPYFNVVYNYGVKDYDKINNIRTIDESLIEDIKNNSEVSSINKVIVDYMNGKKITSADLAIIEDIDYIPSKNLFYIVPILLYIIEFNAKELLKEQHINKIV